MRFPYAAYVRALALGVLLCLAVLSKRAHADEPPPVTPGVFNSPARDANVSHGMAMSSLPMPVPPGRGGVEPSLVLLYTAGMLGDAGYGWSLAIPSIERQMLSGPPRYADPNPGSALTLVDRPAESTCKRWAPRPHNPGDPNGQRDCLEEGEEIPARPAVDRFTYGGEPLVAICSLAAPDRCPKDEVMPSWATMDQGWHYYRLQHDTYTRFFWHPKGRTWRVLDKSGFTSEYGDPLVARRIVANGLDLDVGDKPFRWLLTRQYDAVRDGTGLPVNVTAYRWQSSNQRSQLAEIFYTPPVKTGSGHATEDERSYAHHIVFGWEQAFAGPYPDDRSSGYRQIASPAPVWRAQRSLRLTHVDVSSMPEGKNVRELVRRFVLSYDMRGIAPKPYLKSFQMQGRCAGASEVAVAGPVDPNRQAPVTIYRIPVDAKCPALPPVTLFYSEGTSVPTKPAWLTRSSDMPFFALPTAVDVTGDGIADLVAPDTRGANPPRQSLYVGVGTSNSYPSYRLEEIFTSTADIASRLLHAERSASQVDAWSPFGAAGVFMVTPYVRCRPDDSESGYCPINQKDPIFAAERVSVSGGEAWSWTTIGNYSQHVKGRFGRFDQLGDIDADGLADRRYVLAPTENPNCAVQVLFPGRDALGNALPAPGPDSSLGRDVCGNKPDKQGTAVSITGDEVRGQTRTPRRTVMADMNGDGLADLLVLWTYSIPNTDAWQRSSKLPGFSYFLGDASGNFGSEVGLVVNDKPFPRWDEYLDDPQYLYTADVNGDGYADILVKKPAKPDPPPCANATNCPPRPTPQHEPRVFAAWINMGGGAFLDEVVVGYPEGLRGTVWGPDFADFNGNGTPDLGVVTMNRSVHYVDFAEGQPDNLLVEIHNGLGHTTYFSHDSTSRLDEAASPPWTSHSPKVTYVVTATTESIDGAGITGHKHEINYSYRDPAWDGWSRSLRGFSKVSVTVNGDDNAPTSIVDTQYHFSDCHRIPRRPGSRCEGGASQLDNDIDDTEEGWPETSVTHDAKGNVLATTIWTSSGVRLLQGIDPRSSRSAYVKQVDTWVGDPSSGSETETVTFRDGVSPPCDVTRVCPRPARAVTVDVDVPAKKGRVHLRTRQYVDSATGNVQFSFDDGRVGDEGGKKDETITTQTQWEQVSRETGWLFRPKQVTVFAFDPKPEMPRVNNRNVFYTNNAFGQVTDVKATLEGSLPLARFHEDSSRETAPTPTTAAGDGSVSVAHFEYDAFGNLWRTTSPASGACGDVIYDDAFKDHGTLTKIYTRTGCTEPAIQAEVAEYDRGFGVATITTDARLSTTKVTLDEFGRVTKVYLPDPETGIVTLASTTEYSIPKFQGTGSSWIKTTSVLSDKETRVTWAYFDPAGVPVLSLVPGDKDKTWIAQGLPTLTAKGSVYATYEPWIYEGEGEAHPLTRDASARRSTVRRDAFGRVIEAVAVDGTTKTIYAYPLLGMEVADAENLPGGKHLSGGRSVFRDGHGRTERIVARGNSVVNGTSTFDVLETTLAYQSTGELARVEQGHLAGGDKIVRWMQHDSLGRLVLNAEPNTAKDFTASPMDAGAVARMRAWRYAYDASGRLIGTSDARGCGKNLHYDVVGRLMAEDYSPCLTSQDPYSKPEQGAQGDLNGNGTELFNVYDAFGQLASTRDRGAFTVFEHDHRYRVTDVYKRMAKPTTPVATNLEDRYAPWKFASSTDYDFAGRPKRQSSGADVDALLAMDSQLGRLAGDLVLQYGPRGNVNHIGSSYGTLMKSTTLDPDGFTREVVYGDRDGDHDAVETKATFEPDELRRLRRFTLMHPDAPPSWQSSAPGMTRQITLASWTFERDLVGNVLKISDGRTENAWPEGAKPVKRSMTYDDFYRLTDVAYTYPSASGDVQKSAFAPGALPGSRLPNRVQTQHVEYGWQGNTTLSTADAVGAVEANAAFFERSLSTIKSGDAVGGHPNQLTTAGPYLTDAASKNGVFTAYDAAGNMTSLLVARSACSDPAGLCNHAFAYEWDEVGQLARARRWDNAKPDAFDNSGYLKTQSEVDLRYGYSGAGRVRKTSSVGTEERHTVDVFPSLRLKTASWDATTGDYERTALTEHVYLGGLAHVTVFDKDVTGDASERRHVLLTLGDELGSTSVVIDKKTGELVERATYQAYGAPDSDYRPERWGSFREDFRFTGKEDDAEVGLTYFGARYYHAQLGRWLSADPLAVHAASADLNPYAYVRGSPTNFVDPLGLQECPPGKCPTPTNPKQEPSHVPPPPGGPGADKAPAAGGGPDGPRPGNWGGPGNGGTDGNVGHPSGPLPTPVSSHGAEWVSPSGGGGVSGPYTTNFTGAPPDCRGTMCHTSHSGVMPGFDGQKASFAILQFTLESIAFAIQGPTNTANATRTGEHGIPSTTLARAGAEMLAVAVIGKVAGKLVGPAAKKLDWSIIPIKGKYAGQTRIAHVALHNFENALKPSHGVFFGDGVSLTNEAWSRAQSLGLKADAAGSLTVPMGRQVGVLGGVAGSEAYVPLNSVTMKLVPGSNKLITAFPDI